MCAQKLPDPILITRPADLHRLAESLAHQPIIAVDTESNSLYAYREQVCLVQFSAQDEDFLVDPLVLQDLSPLASIFASSAIEKVFHAAEYDLICLRRDFGFEFTNLFDTMLAARILGRDAVGLGSILEQTFGVRLDKRQQRADWGQRPLPAKLLDYARMDTHFLIELRNMLETELRQRDLWQLASEDFKRLSLLTAIDSNGQNQDEQDELGCWRISGAHDLSPQQAAVLMELCRYRDEQARRRNRPLFKVINDGTLLAIAGHLPKSLEALSSLPGMSPGQIRRHGNSLLRAVQRGLRAQPLRPPRSPRPNEQFSDRLETLRRWRKQTAQTLGMSSDVILPRDLLFSLAEHNPSQPDHLAELLADVPWRVEQFGDQILETLRRMQ